MDAGCRQDNDVTFDPFAASELLISIRHLGLALLLGAVIGVERQWHQKTAGLRTNALVSLASGGFVLFSQLVGGGDPTHVAAQVVSGIGFLGAGVILREGVNIHGLNTAATLWCSAMVGVMCGRGMWEPAFVASGFVIVANIALRPLVRQINARVLNAGEFEVLYVVEVVCRAGEEARIRAMLLQELSAHTLKVRQVSSTHIPETLRVTVHAQAISMRQQNTAIEGVVGRLALEPHVSGVNWQVERLAIDA